MDFSGGSMEKESACNVGDMQEPVSLNPWVRKNLKEGTNPTSVYLPAEPQGQRNLAG